MRILFVTVAYGLNGETDGCATLLKGLVRELNKLGVKTAVLAYGPKTQIYDDPASTGNVIYSHKPLLPVKVDEMPYYTDPLFMFSSTKNKLMQQNFDVVISSTPEFLGKFAPYYCRHRKAKFVSYYITNIRGQFETRSSKMFGDSIGKKIASVAHHIYFKYLTSARLILVMSLDTKRDVKALTSLPVEVVSPGIDTEFFKPSSRIEKNASALFVGRLEAEKNLHYLVPAFKHTKIPLIIVGSGSMSDALKKELPHAHFTGKLTHAELLPLYQQAGFFVFPSTNDTFGIAVLEALSCGLPCVLFDKGGQVEMIKHGVNGFIAQDQSEFTSYIDLLHKDMQLRNDLGYTARESSKYYSWDENGKKLLGILKDLTS